MKKKIIGLIVLILLCGSIGVGHYFVNYALSPASNSSERNVKTTVHASNSNELIMNKNKEDEMKKATQDSHKWALIIHGYYVLYQLSFFCSLILS